MSFFCIAAASNRKDKVGIRSRFFFQHRPDNQKKQQHASKKDPKINKQSRGTWVPLRSLSQSDQGLWALYTINEENNVVRDLVEIVYFEDQYAFVNGTIKDGDLIVLGGATKIIPGKKID